ncbi:MAG TPA: MarR family transcriptional regulator [Solirubrobacteraceae bacterium]|nr:MarR family transcriptional regulator [Solirubrobacteraceae bacterium]
MPYRAAVRDALARSGFDDLPRDGAYVIGLVALRDAPLSEVIRGLGLSKQAAGQLVDTLVTRGYLDRSVDPDDRRRLRIALTERGAAAALEIRQAVEAIDAALLERVGPERLAHARATLAALAELGD